MSLHLLQSQKSTTTGIAASLAIPLDVTKGNLLRVTVSGQGAASSVTVHDDRGSRYNPFSFSTYPTPPSFKADFWAIAAANGPTAVTVFPDYPSRFTVDITESASEAVLDDLVELIGGWIIPPATGINGWRIAVKSDVVARLKEMMGPA